MANRINIKSIGLALLAVFLLTACGQKRPLYLPEEPATNTTTTDSEPSTEPTVQGKN
ncbi:lipoprotein [Paraglaciecola sp. MB-3u-78]|uniref:LPS translocon maturation chaperone LptM n=1 Tax=Paraglaciecola sp. MB-3u-78 TaxID=2058332 RepID=UPI0012FED801|nr:lipoprotein [Paraglaciecola sp. MB-3u-78]